MKIGFDMSWFTIRHTGGREVVAKSLLMGFHEMGLDNDIICFCLEEYGPVIRSCGGFRTIFVPYKRDWGAYSGIRGKIRREFEAGILGTNKVGRFIRKKAKEEELDVILFADKSTPCINFPMKTAFITHDSSSFSVLEIEGLAENSHKYRSLLDRLWLREDIRYRDLTIAISDYDADIIKKYVKGSEKKIARIYDPIIFEEVITNKEKRYIAALNIQAKHKNVVTLIKAFEQIEKKVPYDLILIGKKPKGNKVLDDVLKKIKCPDRIIFSGFLSDQELKDVISKTALYVNPSIYEGFGMTPIEMMGNCVPVIVADNTAQREVTMGLCDYYEDATDEKQLAEAILGMYMAPRSNEELKNISDIVRKKYDHRYISKTYYEILQKLVSGHMTGSSC